MHKSLLFAVNVLAVPHRAMALEGRLESIDDLPDDIKEHYVERDGAFVLDVSGMKPGDEFERLYGAHRKEKDNHSALKRKIKETFGDRPFEEILSDLDRLPELEAAAEGKVDNDKLSDLADKRARTLLAPVERERDNLKNQLNELQGTVGEYQGRERTRKIHDDARKAAVAAKMLPEAIDDFLLLSDRVLEVREDDGKVVVKENSGFTPGVEASVLISDLQSKRPHWWPASAGGGAGGSRKAGDTGSNPWTHAGWNMTEQGRIIASDKSKAEQLAKQAGHSSPIGAKKPEAPAK